MSSEWTLDEATELVMEQMLDLLDGCDDDDEVRPGLVLEMLREVWAPRSPALQLPDDLTAGLMRARIAAARGRLAHE